MVNLIVCFLNGPPRSGKDTAADELVKKYSQQLLVRSVVAMRFAEPVKLRTHAALGIDEPADAFEDCKDSPHPRFHGRTPRECYIQMSEQFFKPLFGEDIFGRLLAQSLPSSLTKGSVEEVNVLAIKDSGFGPEARSLLQYIEESFPRVRVKPVVVRIYRPGCSFDRDSRSYWPINYIREFYPTEVHLQNDGTIAEFSRNLLEVTDSVV